MKVCIESFVLNPKSQQKHGVDLMKHVIQSDLAKICFVVVSLIISVTSTVPSNRK